MAQTTWSVQAIDDLSGIEDYLRASSANYAELVVDELLAKVELLAKFPEMGRVVPEMNLPALREIIVKNYRIVYYLSFQDEVEIVTIRHSSRPLNDTNPPFG
jgi:toxin ParE1/3/4